MSGDLKKATLMIRSSRCANNKLSPEKNLMIANWKKIQLSEIFE